MLVEDPTRGYGIFAEDMLAAADAATAEERNEASQKTGRLTHLFHLRRGVDCGTLVSDETNA